MAWETIRSLRALGKTILLTTHYIEEAQQLADQVAVLRAGRIVAIGTPGELIGAAPATEIRYRLNGEVVVVQTEEPTRVLHELTSARARRRRRARGPGGAAADARGGLPDADRGAARMRLFAHELKAQQRLFWRSRELAFFTFMLPGAFCSSCSARPTATTRSTASAAPTTCSPGCSATAPCRPPSPAWRSCSSSGGSRASSSACARLRCRRRRTSPAVLASIVLRLRARDGAHAHDRTPVLRHRPARPLAVARSSLSCSARSRSPPWRSASPASSAARKAPRRS